MVTHFIFMSSSYSLGTRIALDFIVKDESIQLKLKKDLDKNELPCIIFTHFGLAEDRQIGNYWFEKNPEDGLMSNRKEVKKIIKSDENIIAIFNGHQHWTKQLKEDGKVYYIVGSLTDNVDMQGIPDGVYLEVELQNRNVKIIEKHIQVET